METKKALMIRDFPVDDRPRERLIKTGPESLSTQEIVAILLRTGTKSESVLQLANRLLTKFDGLMWLKDAAFEELISVKGIGKAKAVQLVAAVELGRRISKFNV